MESKINTDIIYLLKIFVFFCFIATFFLPFLRFITLFSDFSEATSLVQISRLIIKTIFSREDMFLIAGGLIFLFSLYLAPLLFIIFLPAKKFVRIKPVILKKSLLYFFAAMYALYLFICYLVLPPSPSLLPVAVIFMIPVILFLFIILFYLKNSDMIIENCLICFMQPASYALFWNFFVTGGRNYMYGAYAYFFIYAVLFIVSFVQVLIFIRRKSY